MSENVGARPTGLPLWVVAGATILSAACGGGGGETKPAPASATSAPADFLFGALVYAHGDGASATPRSLLLIDGKIEDRALTSLPSAAYPGPAQPGEGGRWAAVVTIDDSHAGHRESLHLVDPEADKAFDLGVSAEFVRNPVWTPGGSFLVFESSANSFRDLYRVARTGGEITRLTDAPHGSFEPAISPHGLTLAFGSSRDGNAEVYTQPLAGGDAHRLTNDPADDRAPAWRPDGARLAWLATRGGQARVWTMAPDGRDAAPLREGATEDLHFAWSPDGRSIAVATQTAPREVDIVVYDAVRGLQIGAFSEEGVEEQPAWSPDSRWLAFSANRDGNTDIYVAHPDGSGLRRLTTDPEADWLPRWMW